MAELAPRSFTERVRQELGRLVPDRGCDSRAELAALVFLAGSLHLRGGEDRPTLRIEITTGSGAVARTAFALLQAEAATIDPAGTPDAERPEVRVHAPHGLRSSSSYVVVVESGARTLARRVGLLDEAGRPRRIPPEELTSSRCDALAFARGALLAGGSVSSPSRRPHLEVAAPTAEVASRVADVLAEVSGGTAGVSRTPGGARAVMKSRAAIGRLLAELGATDAYLEWEEQRTRRQVRATATRLANADAANLRRAVEAASGQIAAVERAVEAVGWETLPDPLRAVALARLANPEASLAELGALCDPPVGKSAVHRRLERLLQIAEEAEDPVPDRPSGTASQADRDVD